MTCEGVVHERLVPPQGIGIPNETIDQRRLRWIHLPGAKSEPGRNFRLLDAELRRDRELGRPSSPRTLFYFAAEVANVWSLRQDDDVLLGEVRRALSFSIAGQARPRRQAWLPLPPDLLEALPPDVAELFHQAGGVG